ncbi:MAG: patatin-like phospholipase family protein [Acidimicrobiales bacterium]
MTTAWILPGGASLGAVQVGMLGALYDAGVVPDLLVGTSVGAMNAAYLGLHPGAEGVADLARLWTSLRRRDMVKLRPTQALAALAGHGVALFDRSGLVRALAAELGNTRLEDLALRVAVVAADVVSGEPAVLRQGPALQAVLASSAMPGIFAPVPWEGQLLMDGSVAADIPLAECRGLGADEIWVLTTAPAKVGPPRGALGLATHAFAVVTGAASRAQLELARQQGVVHVLPPPVAQAPDIFDVSRSQALIDESYQTTAAWLAASPDAVVSPGQRDSIDANPGAVG